MKDKINKPLPPGIAILKVFEIPIDAPKLQKEILFAEYIATLETSLNPNIIDSLIHSDSIIQTRRGKTYDLRPLIIEIKLLPTKNQKQSRIYLKLLAKEGATGRPDEVLRAMGIDYLSAKVHRSGLIFRNEFTHPNISS